MKTTQNISQTNSLNFVAWLLLVLSFGFPAIVPMLKFSDIEEKPSLSDLGEIYRNSLLTHVERDYPSVDPALSSQIIEIDPQEWALVELAICQQLKEHSTESPQEIASELTTYVPRQFRSISAGAIKAANCQYGSPNSVEIADRERGTSWSATGF
ncbi:MAG: hypothetical protein SWY16_02465 [Cyanobacteriota bacterium]|nr:hypothetical protein [Cyanobacteriota bacterium]